MAAVAGITTAKSPVKRKAPARTTPISDAPKLVVSKRLRRTPETDDPQREYQFLYLDKYQPTHRDHRNARGVPRP